MSVLVTSAIATGYTDQAAGLRAIREGRPERETRRFQHGTSPRFVAFTSGKGGVGKSQIAANVAVLLAKAGKRVLLVDGDLGLASLDLVLGVTPRRDLLEAVRRRAPVEELLVPVVDGLDLLPACPGRFEMANLDSSSRQTLVDAIGRLGAGYDVVLVDAGSGLGVTSYELAAAADLVVLVVDGEPASLRDAYAMTKLLARRAGHQELHVIANRVTSSVEGAMQFARLSALTQRFLPVSLCSLGSIPDDLALRDASAHGLPVVLRHPASGATRAIAAVASMLRQAVSPRASLFAH